MKGEVEKGASERRELGGKERRGGGRGRGKVSERERDDESSRR